MYSSQGFSQFSSERKKCVSYGIEMMLRLSNLFNQMSDLCKNALVEFSKDLTLNEDFERVTKYRISDEKQQRLTVVKKAAVRKQSPDISPFQKIRGRKLQESKPQLPKSRRYRNKEQPQKLPFPQEIIEQQPKGQQKPKPRRSQRPERGTRRPVPIVEQRSGRQLKEKTQKVQILEKKQSSVPKRNNELNEIVNKQQQKSPISPIPAKSRMPRPKIKQPILLENSQVKQPLGKRINRSINQTINNVVLSISQSQISSQPSDYKARRSSNRRRQPSSSNRSRKGNNSRRKSRTKSQPKDGQSARKRPINGFMRFFQQVKDQIKKNNKISRLPDLSYLISVQWNKLTKKQQEKYNDAYYNDLEKMKEEGKEVGGRERRKSSGGARRRGGRKKELRVKEVEEVEDYEVEGEIKDESGQEQKGGDDNRVVVEHQSVSPSQQAEDQGESSAKQGKPRKFLKVKRPTPKKDHSQQEEQQKEDNNDEPSPSQEFSVSNDDNEQQSSSSQDNSESSSDEMNQAKESKSNSKSQQMMGKSGGKKKE